MSKNECASSGTSGYLEANQILENWIFIEGAQACRGQFWRLTMEQRRTWIEVNMSIEM